MSISTASTISCSIEFAADGEVAGCWGLTRDAVIREAHSVVPSAAGGQVTKLAVRGEWKQRADLIDLSPGSFMKLVVVSGGGGGPGWW